MTPALPPLCGFAALRDNFFGYGSAIVRKLTQSRKEYKNVD
jgi:hypothetical protein